jgi:hypothetical protein
MHCLRGCRVERDIRNRYRFSRRLAGEALHLQPAPITWSACYLGGNIGAGWDRFSAGEVGFAGAPTPFVDYGSNTGSSFIGGGQVGRDYQFAPNWVIGIQGNAEFGNISSSNPIAAFPSVTAVFKPKNAETLTGRLGYTLAPTVLAYVKGGAAWSKPYAAASTAFGLRGNRALQHDGVYGGRWRRVDVRARLVGVRRI